MLILIENEPRDYAWGSFDAMANLLRQPPTGRPQAELWMGVHPLSPSRLAKASPAGHTLLDLIEDCPERYGIDGGQLPYLLKVLAIDTPLSLQAHPTNEQAAAGYKAENERGVPLDAPNRNYCDTNNKPELLVALGEVEALSGFRPIREAKAALLELVEASPPGEGKRALQMAADFCGDEDGASRRSFLEWALGPGSSAKSAVRTIAALISNESSDFVELSPLRLKTLRRLCSAYPGDPGILVSLFMHVVELVPGEALFLPAGQLHAYLSGLAVEVMASSDNVLRGGLTPKHIDVTELCRVADFDELESPRFAHTRVSPGLVAWEPPVPDFKLLRATLATHSQAKEPRGHSAEVVTFDITYPTVLLVTAGKILVERSENGATEFIHLARGQAIYISAGEPLQLTGNGEAFVATVGNNWSR